MDNDKVKQKKKLQENCVMFKNNNNWQHFSNVTLV